MNPQLHVTLITETFPPEINGVANTLGRLCDGLRLRGHRVELVRPRQVDDQSQTADANLLLCRGWPIPGYPGLQWGQSSMHKLLRRWTRQRPDVLYIATEGPLGLSALRAARRLGITVISGFHTNFQQYTVDYGLGVFSRLLTHYLRWFHNRSQMTVVPSASQKLELGRRGFERIELLSRGVDSQLFHPAKRCMELRQSWGLRVDDIAVLHVGRLAPEKNLGLLKTSFDALQATYPKLRLKMVVVGDGPKRAVLEQQMPDAIFCGTQRGEMLAAHYASADLFVFPSLTETFGNVVLEALASGLGVIAYDEAAAAQHILHGHNGALAMPGDEQGFIDAARWVLKDSETLRSVRLNARKHAIHQGWEAIIDAFEQQLRSTSEQGKAVPMGQIQV
ncbi:glycosyltransferase family 1 protein [Pseudomonas sp. 10B1]|uniref:glycosyltransferase family 4 protein n=1 Tax=unclassified Pseudomonas TaxID=196821 RepID=UPI002AB43D06|nr:MULTISPECIES: glycosyltransferase family 1 protein [unclassified Pseudomonas]MDY7559058.1 glycosyltransferase family 1 protein [Pseudomonas sp. AB6]MEA9996559.1 glycosyltransferase family 1 protein [Pseudomonas sp. AA4]MEB0086742.1 glycosyltransferase family 1 protein [Pseudomonas sp. RTI1]MEB0124792.1 glycosyltransferase family 1 protein [Pseudomonas sp. CCC1.2]MEB0155032.1 glycosyltransferase family 1 protein [Pseudomonas sp. CCC4.3]